MVGATGHASDRETEKRAHERRARSVGVVERSAPTEIAGGVA